MSPATAILVKAREILVEAVAITSPLGALMTPCPSPADLLPV